MKHIVTLLAVLLVSFAFVGGAVFAAGAGEEKTAPGQMGTSERGPGTEGVSPAQSPSGQRPMTPGERAMMSTGNPMAVPRADAIIGLAVLNEEGQDLGKVADLTFSDDGRIVYLVISRGGFLGFGSKLCAIPWQAATTRIHENALIVNLSEERLDQAPTFENWADLIRGDYELQVRAYYGEESGVEGQVPRVHPKGMMSPDTGMESESGMPIDVPGKEHE